MIHGLGRKDPDYTDHRKVVLWYTATRNHRRHEMCYGKLISYHSHTNDHKNVVQHIFRLCIFGKTITITIQVCNF